MYLLIPAAGSGRRMGADRNKLLLPLLGEPILAWTLRAAAAARSIAWIGVIAQPVDRPEFEAIAATLNLNKPVVFVAGGATRQESVHNGLRSLPPEAERVLIHDGARCLATPELFDRCSEVLARERGLIAAIAVKDTIKVVGGDRRVESTPDRAKLWAAQTPQGFEVQTLRECHDRGLAEGWEVTDDAALFERCGLPVAIVEGEETNLKVTTPQDLAIGEFILRQRGHGGS
ncbi:MAG: 2-C-methyl-D-erythritol 4-phosphate cytidylyltransferase [Cyanobacteria bacterium]|nr:2-C-methyl-D-erythritol 4-phosphate cytidylyltransferase [Cyanobacteriota bacterium]